MTRFYFLGPPEIRDDTGKLVDACTQSQSLIAYLATRPGRGAEREALAGVLWENADPEKQRTRLNTAIWRCRRMLADAGLDPEDVLYCSGTRISVRKSAPLWLDFEQLHCARQMAVDPAEPATDCKTAQQLEATSRLFRGGFLPGVDADWCLIERESLNLAYQAVLDWLLAHHEAMRAWPSVIDVANRMLVFDPLLEHAHRAKIRAHGAVGERANVVRQYERCRDLLQVELGVQPLPETEAAFRQAMSLATIAPEMPSNAKGSLSGVISELKSALQALEKLNTET